MVIVEPAEVMKAVAKVEEKTGYIFDPEEVSQTVSYTIRKCDLNQKDVTYFYILLENELRDYLMRVCINYSGEQNRLRKEKAKCAAYVE